MGKQVERILAQDRAPAGPSGNALHGGCSEAQLDQLARSVQVEVVQPLHEQIKSLSRQVRTLREELRRLKQRWTAERLAHITRGSTNAGSPPLPRLGTTGARGIAGGAVASTVDMEEAQAATLQR